jgi:hypothetical protein
MYITHDLRVNLQEWKSRLYKASPEDFRQSLNFFLGKLEASPGISSILVELAVEECLILSEIQNWMNNLGNVVSRMQMAPFDSERLAAIHYYYLLRDCKTQAAMNYLVRYVQTRNSPSERLNQFIETYVDPFVNYIHDQLDKGSSTLYLLEKYKRYCEWFRKDHLFNLYERSEGRQEAVLDKDLRLFLFEQGIDYPFSQPSSTSGSADIVGLLETEDPLVLEVKVFDLDRNYGRSRVIGGFHQIVSYSNDYNKPIGYLLIFNTDKSKYLEVVTTESGNKWPTRITFNGKIFFIIIIDIYPNKPSASVRGQIEKYTVHENELTVQPAS